ncbi:hypothetical protein ACVW1C_002101 [Bradyrhizobium sp. USDA 4011]
MGHPKDSIRDAAHIGAPEPISVMTASELSHAHRLSAISPPRTSINMTGE